MPSADPPPGADVVVRPVADADLAAVTAIYAHYVETTVITFDEEVPTVAAMAARAGRCAAAGLPFLVAEVGGVVRGYAYAAPYHQRPAYRFTVEDSVYVAPDARGQGLGRRLLAAVLAGCEAAGVRLVVAVIADSGDGASPALHASFGFEVAGRLRGAGWKLGRWVDTLQMQRALGAGATTPPT